jgi:hypothetical protein
MSFTNIDNNNNNIREHKINQIIITNHWVFCGDQSKY